MSNHWSPSFVLPLCFSSYFHLCRMLCSFSFIVFFSIQKIYWTFSTNKVPCCWPDPYITGLLVQTETETLRPPYNCSLIHFLPGPRLNHRSLLLLATLVYSRWASSRTQSNLHVPLTNHLAVRLLYSICFVVFIKRLSMHIVMFLRVWVYRTLSFEGVSIGRGFV